jgi:hypothetical protein
MVATPFVGPCLLSVAIDHGPITRVGVLVTSQGQATVPTGQGRAYNRPPVAPLLASRGVASTSVYEERTRLSPRERRTGFLRGARFPPRKTTCQGRDHQHGFPQDSHGYSDVRTPLIPAGQTILLVGEETTGELSRYVDTRFPEPCGTSPSREGFPHGPPQEATGVYERTFASPRDVLPAISEPSAEATPYGNRHSFSLELDGTYFPRSVNRLLEGKIRSPTRD